jgi:hypothetical protein
MFDENDPEKLIRDESRVPDGLIDGTQYAEIFSRIVDYMDDIDSESYLSNITWIMKCVNECYSPDEPYQFDKSRSLDTVTALSYFIMTLIGAIDDQELIDNYIEVQRNEVVPDLNKNASIIPFYDVENDVNNILQMLESEDPFNDE